MVKIILHGCSGRMGKMIAELCKDQEQVAIVAGIDPDNCDGLGFPVYQRIKDCQEASDVVIDFSTAPAIPQLIQDCVEKKLPLVLCTTGISEEVMSQVQAASLEIPILRSANMSLGINVLMQALQDIAKKIVLDYAKAHIDVTDNVQITLDNVFIVWFCKTLQNWKALVSTTLPDGMYYEVTYNGDKKEVYLDAYKKFENRKIDEFPY